MTTAPSEAQTLIGQPSLEVLKKIVNTDKRISKLRLISHEVAINWRQVYSDNKSENQGSSFLHTVPLNEMWVKREDFLSLELDGLPRVEEYEVWSVNSKVECYETPGYHSEYYRHIPMMNFHFEESASEEDMYSAIGYICKEQQGFVLESGRYYHYYGSELMDEEQWRVFLGEFLMPCIIVSPRYVGHALYDGYCSLRLTNDRIFKTKIPIVVKEI